MFRNRMSKHHEVEKEFTTKLKEDLVAKAGLAWIALLGPGSDRYGYTNL